MRAAAAPLLAAVPCAAVSPPPVQPVRAPPRGWNSWDCFQGNLNETGALAVAENMVKYLLPHGYDVLTIDEFWYSGNCGKAGQCTDANGRPQPDVSKWPSAAGGKGLRPFADKVHAMGLRLGIHTLRGSVSADAVASKSPILGGGGATVDQIKQGSACPWNKNWYAADSSHPAGQAFLDSVYQQYADWGVDFIKNDCIFANNMELSNIKMVSAAITKTGRPMAYSLSPGQKSTAEQAASVAKLVNIYRITGDWHGNNMGNQEKAMHLMTPYIGVPGLGGTGSLSFPDPDMLNPYTNARDDENQRAQMTLWSIGRGPLIYGADIRSASLTADDFALLTNDEVLGVQARSTHNRRVYLNADGSLAWTADSADGGGTHVALFGGSSSPTAVSVSYAQLNLTATVCNVRDLWAKKDLGPMKGNVTAQLCGCMSKLAPAGQGPCAALYTLTDCH